MIATDQRPLAAHRRFASVDVDEVRDAVARVYCSHRLHPVEQRQGLDAWQNSVALSRIGIGAMGYGASVTIDPGCLETFFLVMLPYAGRAAIDVGGRSFVADRQTATMLSPVDPVRMAWDADCAKTMVRIDRDALEQQLSILLDRPLRQPLVFRPEMPLSGNAATWWHYVGGLIDALDRGAAGPATLRQIEALLLTGILEAQPHNYSEMLSRAHAQIAPRHVRLVERYIDEHLGDPITMADLVLASGVSSRSLFEGFNRFRDMSPMGYLRLTRVRRVHDRLANGELPMTVSDVASDVGVTEFGRFAGQYRQLYGETPSETLRRRIC